MCSERAPTKQHVRILIIPQKFYLFSVGSSNFIISYKNNKRLCQTDFEVNVWKNECQPVIIIYSGPNLAGINLDLCAVRVAL